MILEYAYAVASGLVSLAVLCVFLLFFASVGIGAISAVIHDRKPPESLRDRAFWLSRGIAYLTLGAAGTLGAVWGLVVTPMVTIILLGFFFLGLVGVAYATKGFRMTADDTEDSAPEPVPDSDPRHIDPAGDLADAVESGDLGLSLAEDQDAEELREFVERAEAGEFDPVDPGLEAQVRIARALLEESDTETG